MRKRWTAWLLALVLGAALTGCADKAEEPEQPEESVPVIEVVPPEEPETYVPEGTNPLTGLPMEPEYEKCRPVAVMLNNLKAAQPQLGVSQADLIYEVPAEGGITRMLALYQCLEGVENLGSIRSTRAYYIELATGHDAVLVHAGGSPEAYQDIRSWGIDNIDGVNGGASEDAVFWRDAERRKHAGYEHSMLTSGEKILAFLGSGKFRLNHSDGYSEPLTFAEDGTPSGGTAASHIKLRYTNYKTGLFDYDAGAGTYLISQYGGAYTDGNSGEQVGVTNVLFLETSVSVISGDKEGRLSVKTTGSGEGTFFCGGKSVPIRWSRADRNSPFVYTLESGAPLTLGKGHTYVCILDPRTSSVTVE